MIEPNNLSPFRHFCMTIGAIPTSYKESLTYYEMLEWLCKYLEETVIPAVNNNAEALEELQTAFVTLKDYVDHYFDNLDIQTEINAKLDEMAESGELADIIAQYLQLSGVLAYDSVADLKAATNLVNGSFAETYGYYNYKDGGGALYKVRNVINTDEPDDVTVIALADENLVAELIIDKLNVKQFGAKGDGTTDDTEAIQKALDYLRVYPRNEKDYSDLYFPEGTYLVTDTLTITNGRWFKIHGKATITANMNKPILYIHETMFFYINDLLFYQENTGSDSACIHIDECYIGKLEDMYCNGGDKGIIIKGNNITLDSCNVRYARINVYTLSSANNTQNTLINCAIERATDYNIYIGYGTSYYGLWNITNCYLEGDTTSLVYIINGMRVYFNKCYFNQTGSKTVFSFDGTIPIMSVHINDCQIVTQGYVYREFGQNRTICAYVSNNDITGTLYKSDDTYLPSIVSEIPNKLNIYNLTWLHSTNGTTLDAWEGAGSYTLTDTVSEESEKAVTLSSSYIFKRVYLKQGVTYKIECIMKNNGSGEAQLDIYDGTISSRKSRLNTTSSTFTKVVGYYKPVTSDNYCFLLRNNGTYCGVNIYSLEV